MEQLEIANIFLNQYSLNVTNLEFLGHSDKIVYKVTADTDLYVLSVYFASSGTEYMQMYKELYSYEHINAEMEILSLLRIYTELKTAVPLKNANGEYVSAEYIDEYKMKIYATVVSFIDGVPMDDKAENYLEQAYAAGQTAALLHNFSNGCVHLKNLEKRVKDEKLLNEIEVQLSKGIEAGNIDESQFRIFQGGIGFIKDCMRKLYERKEYNYGFIHTDLRAANFIMAERQAVPIDFSRYEHGFLLYDLGEMCAHMGGEPIQRQILSGYHSIRKLNEFDIKCITAGSVLFLIQVACETITQKGANSNLSFLLTSKFIPQIFEGTFFSDNIKKIVNCD